MSLGLIEKILFFEEIAGRVAGECEFGKDGHFRACCRCAAGECEDSVGVPIQIADGGVCLRKGDLHPMKTIVRRLGKPEACPTGACIVCC